MLGQGWSRKWPFGILFVVCVLLSSAWEILSGLQKQNRFFVLLKSEYKLSFYTHIWLGSQAAGAQGVAP